MEEEARVVVVAVEEVWESVRGLTCWLRPCNSAMRFGNCCRMPLALASGLARAGEGRGGRVELLL